MTAKATKVIRPPLKIHRFTPSNRINKARKSNSTKPADGDEEETVDTNTNLDKNSKEYLDALINKIFQRLNSPQGTFEDHLPALTSSSEIDLQLHAIVGLLLQNFVLRWYDRITDDYSNEFLIEVVYTVAHITRNLEEKLRKVDYKQLIFDEAFVVVDLHRENYYKAVALQHTNLLSVPLQGSDTDQLVKTFEIFEPHVAIQNQLLYLKTLTDNLLKRTLPVDTYNSELTRSILVTLIQEFALQNCVEKLSEPYLIWEIIGKVCDILLRDSEKERSKNTISDMVRNLSHVVAYATSVLSLQSTEDDKPVLQFHVLVFLNNMFNFMYNFPILSMLVSIFSKFFGTNTKLNHVLHNLITNFIFRFLLNEGFIFNVLAIARSTIFPKDDLFYLEPRFIPTTEEELKELMLETKTKITAVFDKYKFAKWLIYYNDENQLSYDLTQFLQVFAIKDINKHLVLMLLDLLFLNVFPDMAHS